MRGPKSKSNIWDGRSAEALLYRRSRIGDASLPLPPLFAVQGSDPSRSLQSSASAPALTPVSSKRVLVPVNSFGVSQALNFMQREPAEFAQQRENLCRRKAKAALHVLYRHVIEDNLGLRFKEEAPWPPKEPKLDEGSRAPLHAVYRAPPASLQALEPLDRAYHTTSSWAPSMVGTTGSGFSRNRGSRGAESQRRKEAVMQLKSVGRGTHGSPFTLCQIIEEVEAVACHRPVRDLRAQTGYMGPQSIGAGTTRSRRRLPPFSAHCSLEQGNRPRSSE